MELSKRESNLLRKFDTGKVECSFVEARCPKSRDFGEKETQPRDFLKMTNKISVKLRQTCFWKMLCALDMWYQIMIAKTFWEEHTA